MVLCILGFERIGICFGIRGRFRRIFGRILRRKRQLLLIWVADITGKTLFQMIDSAVGNGGERRKTAASSRRFCICGLICSTKTAVERIPGTIATATSPQSIPFSESVFSFSSHSFNLQNETRLFSCFDRYAERTINRREKFYAHRKEISSRLSSG